MPIQYGQNQHLYYELVCNVAIENISIPIVKEAEPNPKDVMFRLYIFTKEQCSKTLLKFLYSYTSIYDVIMPWKSFCPDYVLYGSSC